MSKIQILSEHLTNMIAAGEVVERPAGIVKECVENSIDAGAKVIDIEAFQGGIEKLIITDDGSGMDYEDAQMAFMRHATSKLQQEEDLFNIHTMGFRGEALPSIASVAKVELQTNDGNQGTLIRYHYGELVTREKCSCPLGTRIEISSLFLKTPARFKHLKVYRMNLVSLPIWSIKWLCLIRKFALLYRMMDVSCFKLPEMEIYRKFFIRCMEKKWHPTRFLLNKKAMIFRFQVMLYSQKSTGLQNILCLLR